jgi:ArsR family transcriptional regulator
MADDLQPNLCARLLRALAEPDRLRIVHCLRAGPKNVGEIADELGAPVVNVSHHLRLMREAGLLLDEKQGRFVHYRLHPDVFTPDSDAGRSDHLDLGCCRLEMPKP